MYRAGIEWLLGLTLEKDILNINPCIPEYWQEFTIYYQHESSSYEINIQNKYNGSNSSQRIRLDGVILSGKGIPLVNDGMKHLVELII